MTLAYLINHTSVAPRFRHPFQDVINSRLLLEPLGTARSNQQIRPRPRAAVYFHQLALSPPPHDPALRAVLSHRIRGDEELEDRHGSRGADDDDERDHELPFLQWVNLISHVPLHCQRYVAPSYNFFNHGLGITYLHLGFQYVEFALLERPVIDPYITKARSRIISALDLSINSRIVGLGPVGLGGPTSHAKQSASTAGADGADGGVNIGGKESPENHERWLPYVDTGRSRFQACLRHVIHSYVHFVVFDTLMHLARYYGSGTLNQPDGYPDALDALMSIKSFVLLPRTYPIRLPNSIVEIACELSLAAGVWQSLSWGYHLIAFLLVGSGFWETESWEVDLFDAPWKADSLMDLWGKRWHQVGVGSILSREADSIPVAAISCEQHAQPP